MVKCDRDMNCDIWAKSFTFLVHIDLFGMGIKSILYCEKLQNKERSFCIFVHLFLPRIFPRTIVEEISTICFIRNLFLYT